MNFSENEWNEPERPKKSAILADVMCIVSLLVVLGLVLLFIGGCTPTY